MTVCGRNALGEKDNFHRKKASSVCNVYICSASFVGAKEAAVPRSTASQAYLYLCALLRLFSVSQTKRKFRNQTFP